MKLKANVEVQKFQKFCEQFSFGTISACASCASFARRRSSQRQVGERSKILHLVCNTATWHVCASGDSAHASQNPNCEDCFLNLEGL